MKNEKITLKGGYVPCKIENIHEHLQEVNRGKGVHKSKKGKGSYNRKAKYGDNNSYLAFWFFYLTNI